MNDDACLLTGTTPLTMEGDLAEQMVAGLDAFLERELDASVEHRATHWQRDFASHAAYVRSVAPHRERFRRCIGALDTRLSVEALDLIATTARPARVGTGRGYEVFAVRWPVLEGVDAEGLLLQPEQPALAGIVALPDCDWTPEMLVGLAPGVPLESQFARRLAQAGCRVVVPVLLDRRDTCSGNPDIRMTNQPHREFIYRGAFQMGRHVIGYEVQKVLAAVDWFVTDRRGAPLPIGVIGYGEGGLLAFYSAAADTRIGVAAVSGYFQPREEVWHEPIYRNVWRLLAEFGDAEIASLITPRPLLIEACQGPEVAGPPAPTPGRSGAAPGALSTPPLAAVAAEVARAHALTAKLTPPTSIELIPSGDGSGPPACEATLAAFLGALSRRVLTAEAAENAKDRTEGRARTRATAVEGASTSSPNLLLSETHHLATASPPPSGSASSASSAVKLSGPSVGMPIDTDARHQRQFRQMVEHNQRLMHAGEFRRAEFWAKADAADAETWQESSRAYREYLWEAVIGRFPAPSVPPNPRSRLVFEAEAYRGYEVVLDVWPGVFAYGILLLPRDLAAGERRPVVVCQHGLEGRPRDVADPSVNNTSYNQYACRLAERGFITYAPQNPYIGGDRFRVLQRKANPLGKSLFALIAGQHQRTLEWLSALPCVDPTRIAFYGLSYGGKSAMRLPALLEQYCLSICSADYNEWIWKNVSTCHRYSYMFTGEYEMFEFDLGNTFNYAEMSWLICPRPFMVERGHHDGVAPDEWVAYEYARTRRRYDLLAIGDRTELEVFNGPHTIHGEGTFAFLERHLR